MKKSDWVNRATSLLCVISLVGLIHCSTVPDSFDAQLCMVLGDIMQMPLFDKQFYVRENASQDLIIVDAGGALSECWLDSIAGRNIVIRDTSYSKSVLYKNNNIVTVAVGYKFEGRLVSFGFLCPANGGYLTMNYDISDGNFNLLGYTMGDY